MNSVLPIECLRVLYAYMLASGLLLQMIGIAHLEIADG
jgi:hypothetical protein